MRDFDSLLYEIPKHIFDHAYNCIAEIDILLYQNNLSEDDISFDTIKDKFGRLRIYWHFPRLTELMLEDECDEDEYNKYVRLQILVDEIIDKFEKIKFS